MARIILTMLGFIFLSVGIWVTVAWWDAVKMLLLAAIALGLLLLGLGLLIFGISEITGARTPDAPGEMKRSEVNED